MNRYDFCVMMDGLPSEIYHGGIMKGGRFSSLDGLYSM